MRRLAAILCLAFAGCATVDRPAPQFHVGDVAVARNFSNYPHLNGTHVRVTGDYQYRWIKGGNTLRCYAITTVDGRARGAGFPVARVEVTCV